MDLTLRVWRQASPDAPGRFETYPANDIDEHASLLEMLDIVNDRLLEQGIEPIAFDSDCREGICGTCGLMVDGKAHGPMENTAVCQVHMFNYADGDTITIEPWRARGFPLRKDLIVDRSAFDEIISAGGYVSVNTGSAPGANLTPVPKPVADRAFDAAACIGCGACVAACPNGAAQLFAAAKVAQLNMLPQGQPERYDRTERVVSVMEEHFGSCTNYGECQVACPQDISIDFIAWLNKDYRKAKFTTRKAS